jgi:cyclopropane fatty-acyl-phospholipid synthase-like methyltransferase
MMEPILDKPYSPACERNQTSILAVLKPLLVNSTCCLEVGSGTGQHAVYFAQAMPDLTWQCSDVSAHLAGINRWLKDSRCNNTPAALALDVFDRWPDHLQQRFDTVFTANTLHIMSRAAVSALFSQLGQLLHRGGQVFIYGPFNQGGDYSSDSNAEFDQWLKARDPVSGIRDLEWIEELASEQALTLKTAYEMPANNKLLHFIC